MISRVMENTKEEVAEEQRGFRSGRRCIDQIFVLKQLVEKYREKRRSCMLYSWIWRMLMIKFVRMNCGECCMNMELILDRYLIRSMISLYDERGFRRGA